jgi:hypothetical protein
MSPRQPSLKTEVFQAGSNAVTVQFMMGSTRASRVPAGASPVERTRPVVTKHGVINYYACAIFMTPCLSSTLRFTSSAEESP